MKRENLLNEDSPDPLCCTWRPEEVCKNCSLSDHLNCRWDMKHLIRFFWFFTPYFSITLTALILGGIYNNTLWWIGVLFGFLVIFLIIETRILCSHCPYYSEEGRILHCLANHGFIKYCRYHPEPLSTLEKIVLELGFSGFAIVPLSGQIFNLVKINNITTISNHSKIIALVILLVVSFLSLLFFFYSLISKVCPRCVNFSCPLNSVSEEIIQEYLKKNPVMENAWNLKNSREK